MQWANLGNRVPVRLTSKENDTMFGEGEAGIVISTYAMIAYALKRSDIKEELFDKIKKIDWGLVIMDEV